MDEVAFRVLSIVKLEVRRLSDANDKLLRYNGFVDNVVVVNSKSLLSIFGSTLLKLLQIIVFSLVALSLVVHIGGKISTVSSDNKPSAVFPFNPKMLGSLQLDPPLAFVALSLLHRCIRDVKSLLHAGQERDAPFSLRRKSSCAQL
ncbi:unnamed protein product [Ceratitis capitata]|uniref:(Mediterranean fruit fly) hypothetical protein n=1 Tax=Ceratitis capitata TaxID=7213 RepID=A0A811UXT9_CERCA|nr:unnamed protein product [Ceratitis capitata]